MLKRLRNRDQSEETKHNSLHMYVGKKSSVSENYIFLNMDASCNDHIKKKSNITIQRRALKF